MLLTRDARVRDKEGLVVRGRRFPRVVLPETRKFMNTRASAAKRETVHKRGGKTRSLVSFANVMERRDARQERTR